MTPKLDYVPRLVEANRAYRVAAPAVDLSKQAVWWTGGVVLDQGQEGACVGFGVTGEAMASPVRVKPARKNAELTLTEVGNGTARDVYRRAKEIDEYEGVDYEGTSVRAGMLVGRECGWYSGFNWAFNMIELRAALQDGPVVIGVEWRSGMYEAPGGRVTVSGDVVGGHCLVVTGYSPNYSGRGPTYRWRNSWGRGPYGYGAEGNGYISAADLDRVLFQAGGEAAVPVGRKA